jgi:DNA-binding GntR family transcriptional regulator
MNRRAGNGMADGVRDGQNVQLVHDRLREAIVRGEIAAGQPTSQAMLAEHLGLGLSRTPLREALRMLQREGLVLSEPNRRIRIADFSIADLEQLYAMRIALEVVAIRATVPVLALEDFAELEGLMAQMDLYLRARDLDRYRLPHAAFHARLVSAAGPRITALLAQLFDHGERYRRSYAALDPAGWSVRREEHRVILDAAAVGDGELAATRLVVHYLHTVNSVIAGLDPGYEPALLRTTIATVAPDALAEAEQAPMRREPRRRPARQSAGARARRR